MSVKMNYIDIYGLFCFCIVIVLLCDLFGDLFFVLIVKLWIEIKWNEDCVR